MTPRITPQNRKLYPGMSANIIVSFIPTCQNQSTQHCDQRRRTKELASMKKCGPEHQNNHTNLPKIFNLFFFNSTRKIKWKDNLQLFDNGSIMGIPDCARNMFFFFSGQSLCRKNSLKASGVISFEGAGLLSNFFDKEFWLDMNRSVKIMR